jgi:hypothetical protein
VKVHTTWPQWEATGAAALFVVFDDPSRVRRGLLHGLDAERLPFAVLVDRDRTAYARWGLTRATWPTILASVGSMRRYWQLWREGERPRTVGEDPRQLGGDFIVAPDGTVAYARPQERVERPPVGELLRAARATVT